MTGHGFTAEELIDGRYRLVGLLGDSATTQSWAARDTRLNRDVAIELDFSAAVADPLHIVGSNGHLAQVYDAGRHLHCTFVVTPPVLQHRPEEQPLPVGEWVAAPPRHFHL